MNCQNNQPGETFYPTTDSEKTSVQITTLD